MPTIHDFSLGLQSPTWRYAIKLPGSDEYVDVTDATLSRGCDVKIPADIITKALKPTITYRLPGIVEVIFNEEAGVTVILWEDGEKTIVRLGDGEHFDRYTGFMAAVCKRLFGGTATAKKLMNANDRKYQAQLKAEAAAKEKAKRIVEVEKQREKAKQRREGFDALVQYYVREFQAKDKAREIMAEQTNVPFDDTEDNA